MKKIRKTMKFFISSNMRIGNSHPYKTENFESQENLKIRNFLPLMENRKFSMPFKTTQGGLQATTEGLQATTEGLQAGNFEGKHRKCSR